MRRLARLGLALALLLLAAGAVAVAFDRLFPLPLERAASHAVLVTDSQGRVLRAFTAADGAWRFPVEPAAVDPLYLRMLVAYEDKRFREHLGVDPLAVLRAAWQWARAGEVVSGASTLTMQTVRLLEPRSRTLGAKLIEAARAVQLEVHLSKDEILALYLTLAPYGGNLEGVRAASLFYFGKSPGHLTPAEAALLVALPQSPERLRPDCAPEAARLARGRVLERMAALGVIGPGVAAEATEDAVPADRMPAPIAAPHLAERLLASAGAADTVAALLDGDLQRALEDLARRSESGLEAGATVAILAVENRTHAVRGYVGSGAFLDLGRHGPVDMIRAVRSPGSTLKPFIYGLAFDGLVVHPETIIADRPMRFGDYAPRNFDDKFHGEVTAREALQMSLNLPAVALLDRIGPEMLASRFALAGVALRLPAGQTRPGLPIALGGVGVTLEDLVRLYSGLADHGIAYPLRLRPTDPEGEGVPLMSPLAAWYVTRILEGMPPPPNRLYASDGRQRRLIAYKTGTSYGFRDAWAIGYDRDDTIGVWVGRPDGSYAPDRMGRDWAAPILFAAFDLLAPPSGASAMLPPSGPAPAGAILAENAELPPALRRFQPVGELPRPRTGPADGPKLAFPEDGATVELGGRAGALPSLPLQAVGGELPYVWLVNGSVLPASPFRRQAEWQPDGRGEARITVIDRMGRSASAEVWIE
jgi:penicillin-binding protein 1C